MAVTPSHPLVIERGDDRPLPWALTDTVTGQPVDLDGYAALGQVHDLNDPDLVLHEWSTGAGNAVLAESTLILKVDDSDDWTWHRGAYVLRVIDPTGAVEIIDRGPVVVI